MDTTPTWRESAPHAALLAKFRSPRSRSHYDDRDYWARALREPVRTAVTRFVDEGYLRPTTLEEQLDLSLKLTDLKKIAKMHGIKVSGPKRDLIARLITRAADAAREAVRSAPESYTLTALGEEHAARYLAWEAQRLEAAIADVVSALGRGDTRAAALRHREFRRGDIFASADDLPGSDEVEEELKLIGTLNPGILRGVAPAWMPHLRLSCALQFLFGDPAAGRAASGFATGTHFDDETAARMLLFAARHGRGQRRLAEISDFVHHVEVRCVGDGETCAACRSLDGRTFEISKCPELPHADCTSDMGCRCMPLTRMVDG